MTVGVGMKFNCDRCKTRYSISDERVRGKVLKIRCKNCSAVITVREGMTASAPRTPRPSSRSGAVTGPVAAAQPPGHAESALRGAFDDAMAAPSAADSMTGAPASLTTEWYLAIDGNQSGPFDLGGAKGWIQEQAAAAELYCWSEGFDDWLPVEKVSQFRGVRNGKGDIAGLGALGNGTPMPTFDANVEKTPAPLFKSTMERVTAEAPTLLEDDDPMGPRASGLDAQADAARDDAGAFEFDIGEASRVVNLASLVPPSGGIAAPVAANNALPGIAGPVPMAKVSGATSPEIELPRPEVLQPAVAKRSRILLPLLIASGALLVVLGVLLFLAFRESEDGTEEIARGGGSRGDLAHRFEDERKGAKKPDQTKPPAQATKVKTNGTTRRNTPSNNVKTAGSKGYVPPSDEVDLSRGSNDGDVRQGSLEPNDVMKVYRKSQFSVNRCYERAMKKNPLLKVGKTIVNLKVSGSGKVSSVSVPSLSGETLGSCLVISIGRWRFPKSTEGFRGSFPIIFKGN